MNATNSFKLKLLVLLLLNGTMLYADVKLPAIINDEMVLQRETTIPIWGWADPGEKVKIEFAGQTRNAIADSKGNWDVKFEPVKAGGPFSLDIKAKNTIKLKNVLVGEVWVCSGQSNMEWPIALLDNPEEVKLKSNHPKIRLFHVKPVAEEKPVKDCVGRWSPCGPHSVMSFSAVGYYFGRELHDQLDVPIGLISSVWSGSAAEAWTSREVLDADPDYNDIIERHNIDLEKFNGFDNVVSAYKQFEKKIVQWSKDIAEADKKGLPRSEPPVLPTCQPPNFLPAGLYNGMIIPLQKFTIKGVIWYQGESNAFDVNDGSDGVYRANQYRKLFPALIKSWRKDWGIGKFPFYYVQIAPFGQVYRPNAAALIRDAQLKVLDKMENTGMVVTMDIGNVNDIHPRNKQEVGRKLALWALSETYGQKNIVCSGPLYKSMVINGNSIRLSFDYIGSGLLSKGGPLTDFTIAGMDKNFFEAKAVIEGDTIVVSCEKVPNPVAVRYAWSNAAVPNLFNKNELPASPFRTDNWTDFATNKE